MRGLIGGRGRRDAKGQGSRGGRAVQGIQGGALGCVDRQGGALGGLEGLISARCGRPGPLPRQ